MQSLQVKISTHSDMELIPKYQTSCSSGLDLLSAVGGQIEAGCRALIPTGLYLEIPQGFEGQVRPRSGLALKCGVTVLNSPGTIDADYRGEVGVILINLGRETFHFERGSRIAQLVFAEVARCSFVVSDLSTSSRGEGGFGHTGL